MIHQYAINTREISLNDTIRNLFDLISEERIIKVDKFYFEKDKINSLFAELILKYAIWEVYGIDISKIVFAKNDFGKPYIVENKNIHFNISHSGDWVICAVGDKNIGIDVEQIKDPDLSVARRFFTKEDCEYIFKQDSNEKPKAFFKIWTLKESYIKNVGKGLSIPLNSFRFDITKKNIQIYIKNEISEKYLFKSHRLDEHYYMALCAETGSEDEIKDDITFLTVEKILKWKTMLSHENHGNSVTFA